MPQLQFPGFDEPRQREPQLPPMDQRLALDSARAPQAFLHAVIDKPSAVVGEQVTYTVYIYIDGQVGHDLDLADPHEIPADDFVKRSLQADDTKLTALGYANVGGKIFAVQLLRKSALFPLKAGDLDIGEMTLQLSLPGGGVRRSEDLHVHVSEPPVQGRPPGYAIGDVGTFALSADVSGRDIEQDGAIGVTVVLSGSGNLPSSLETPEHAGVEWLDPQLSEKVGPQQRGERFGGSRTFQFVVRLHRAGDIDLGDFTLPYWDPQANRYQVARAALGTIHVRPGASPQAPAEAANDPLPGLPAARGRRASRSRGSVGTSTTPPRSGSGSARCRSPTPSSSPRRGRRSASASGAPSAERRPKTELRARVLAAEEASSKGDAGALDAATARALEAATIAGCEVNVRGLATSDVAQALGGAGVAESDACEVESILRACDAARFSASVEATGRAKWRWRAMGARAPGDRSAGRGRRRLAREAPRRARLSRPRRSRLTMPRRAEEAARGRPRSSQRDSGR